MDISKRDIHSIIKHLSGKWDSNPRPLAWEAKALPTELLPHSFFISEYKCTCYYLKCKSEIHILLSISDLFSICFLSEQITLRFLQIP